MLIYTDMDRFTLVAAITSGVGVVLAVLSRFLSTDTRDFVTGVGVALAILGGVVAVKSWRQNPR